MTRLSRATLEARLDLALAALKRAGEPVGGIEVARDGTVRILASAPPTPQAAPDRGNSCDGKWGGKRGAGR